jgi:hypothetical protein
MALSVTKKKMFSNIEPEANVIKLFSSNKWSHQRKALALLKNRPDRESFLGTHTSLLASISVLKKNCFETLFSTDIAGK